jgi:anti-sigma regulatory factor (Ser/Thr protein kinase)
MWHFVETLARGEMATFLYAVHDTAESSIQFYSAGHPGPLFVRDDGGVVHRVAVPAAPLGVGAPPNAKDTRVELSPGTTMLLYTEALAEGAGERLADRRERIARAATGDPEPEALCSRLLARLVDGRVRGDDVVLLAVQAVLEASETLERTVAAVPEALWPLRRELRHWLAARGADEREIAVITLAAQEACANVVEHAYGLADEFFEFSATHDGPTVEITVRDRGHWRAPRGQNRGRGLDLMHALVDVVDVTRGDAGTSVRLVRRLAGIRGV